MFRMLKRKGLNAMGSGSNWTTHKEINSTKCTLGNLGVFLGPFILKASPAFGNPFREGKGKRELFK